MRDNNEEEIIYLDEEGYNHYMEDIENLKRQLANLKNERNVARSNSVGENWHDNSAIEIIRREEIRISKLLKDALNRMGRIQIVEKKNNNEEIIDINDIVDLDIKDDYEDLGIQAYKLVATERPNMSAEIIEVTINSPLGQSIYQNKVGNSGSFKVLDNTIHYSIVSKHNTKKL